jgi:alkylhydroperoxidase family enzyme
MNQTNFTLYTNTNAPQESQLLLGAVEEKFGFIPNVLRQMAESPVALGATMQLMGLLEQSSLTPGEQWIALLTVALQNASDYCVAANSTVAQMMGVPAAVVQSLRSGKPLTDTRYEALRRCTAEAVKNRGRISQATVQQFFQAGFTKAQLLEVIVAVALETMASYTDHTAGTPMDEQYQANA